MPSHKVSICGSPDAKEGSSLILVTGATGLIGHHVLAELLRQRRACAVLLRPPLADSLDRLTKLLAAIGVRGDNLLAAGLLVPIEGDLCRGAWDTPPVRVHKLVHIAASTDFDTKPSGDPARTNVEGTRRLLRWGDSAGMTDLHLVSSAYVCGRTTGCALEAISPCPASFHNAYEQSKWGAEHVAHEWALSGDRVLTVYRPSIVVGAYDTGRATKFHGFYLSARATEYLERVTRQDDPNSRKRIPLRIRGRPEDHQNIVPVDYVARIIAAAVTRPGYSGRVYHVVHPSPPANRTIKLAFERYFGIGGGQFVEPEAFPSDGLNDHERAFVDISRSIQHYFVDAPQFARDNTASVERATGIRCPGYDDAAIARLIRYAQGVGWGRRQRADGTEAPGCREYFERFLPRHVGKSRIARMTGLDAVIRFVIEDEPNGQWLCRFQGGQLIDVRRGANGLREDFGYRASRAVFWESISGTVHPQEFFLAGRAEVFGDVEAALRMSMILHAFTQECPCDAQVLAAEES